MAEIVWKRIYEQPSRKDGLRILVDRLWPRGISKKTAKLDYWLKDLAPSHELRTSFGHDKDKFEPFKEKYKEELKTGKQKEALKQLNEIISHAEGRVTLLYAAKDKENNNAQVLKQMIQ